MEIIYLKLGILFLLIVCLVLLFLLVKNKNEIRKKKEEIKELNMSIRGFIAGSEYD